MPSRLLRSLSGLSWILLVATATVAAQNATPTRGERAWLLPVPEVQVDPGVPTLEEVVGHAWAEDISSPAQVERYIEALAKSAPDRSRLVRYGETYEGRPLHYLVLSSPDNIARLDAIRADVRRLSDPRRIDPKAAEQLIVGTPGVVWLAYSVHGNETSSSDAALITAYTLLADQRDQTKQQLANLVVIIDPLQNPDGRERFISAYREARGTFPEAARLGREHTERWPGGRFNHYNFDMNRDWFLQTQKETRSKVAAYLQWQPQIYVDAHEMGSESTYYFDPPSDPVNTQITDAQRAWYMRIGRHHADRFDQYGFAYTTRELFDAFYPGYGSTWPAMHGSIGILWEQAGVRGLVVDREDKTQLHYHDAVRHHYISGLATIEAASKAKNELLLDFHRTRASAIESGSQAEYPDYVLLAGNTPSRAADLANLLIDNGIEVRRIETETKVVTLGPGDPQPREQTVPAGSYHVTAAQPAGRLVRTLLDPADDMGEAFTKRQIDRRARRLSDEIYDVTAWSLPLTFGVTCLKAKPVSLPDREPLTRTSKPANYEGPDTPRVGYLVRGEDEAAMVALAEWLRGGFRVHVLDQSTKIQGRDYPKGSLLLRTAENPETLHQAVRETTERYGLSVTGLDSSFVDEGAALGGPNVSWVQPPRIAMPVGDGIGSSVGHTWFLFDQVWRYPVTRVEARTLSRARELDDFNVLILPSGSYGTANSFDESAVTRIKEWVRDGGTLVLTGSATSWAVGESVDLIDSELKKVPVTPIPGEGLDPEPKRAESSEANEGADAGKKTEQGDRSDSSKPKEEPKEAPDPVPGAFLRATVYDDHWVTFGLPGEIEILLGTGLVLEPLKPMDGRNLVTFPAQEKPVSGFCWPRTLEALGRTPYVVYRPLGRGHVIGFTDDPNFRASSPVTSRLFLNAVFLGPGHR